MPADDYVDSDEEDPEEKLLSKEFGEAEEVPERSKKLEADKDLAAQAVNKPKRVKLETSDIIGSKVGFGVGCCVRASRFSDIVCLVTKFSLLPLSASHA